MIVLSAKGSSKMTNIDGDHGSAGSSSGENKPAKKLSVREKLKQRLKQTKDRLAQLDARERTAARQEETQFKVLSGVILHKIAADGMLTAGFLRPYVDALDEHARDRHAERFKALLWDADVAFQRRQQATSNNAEQQI